MKGIILAGGSGSRLYPLTQVVNKQLLPVYDKPMICYPLSTLMLMGIKDIMIISTPRDLPSMQAFLGDGSRYGITLSYEIQAEPRGIAEAFLLAKDFIGNDNVCLILGDNIFHMGEGMTAIRERLKNHTDAFIFGYHVKDPQRFGVIELDKMNGKVVSIEEKPKEPKSSYAAVGLYVYDSTVVQRAEALTPSPRGELEITDLNAAYLAEGKLDWVKLPRGSAWLDAGTPESLMEASSYVAAVESRQGLKIGCLEEVAYRMGYIDDSELSAIIQEIKSGVDYRTYLEKVLAENDSYDRSLMKAAVA